MGGLRRFFRGAARSGSAPARGYFNQGFESTKDEVRRLGAELLHASALDRDGILIAMDRLQDAVGFLGLQLTMVRADLDALKAQLAERDGSAPGEPGEPGDPGGPAT